MLGWVGREDGRDGGRMLGWVGGMKGGGIRMGGGREDVGMGGKEGRMEVGVLEWKGEGGWEEKRKNGWEKG